jgi:formate hydrogenlyase subunit 3/multisubunit Na+/H+ antiporter MnhD subunit
MNLFLIGAVFFLLGGIASVFASEYNKSNVYIIFSAVAAFLTSFGVFSVLITGNSMQTEIQLGEPIGKSLLVLDPLSSFFALIIIAGSFLASVYSAGYMKMYKGEATKLSTYHLFLGLMSTSMIFVVVVQNAILFLISWELMSVASFFLVTFESNKPDVRKAGIYYFTSMQIGVAFLIAGFAWISSLSGSLDFNSFKVAFENYPALSDFFFALFFIGFGTKAGFVPMHTWLPRAHPAAPTGVSALMSGVMIKTGIYGILRIIFLINEIHPAVAFSVLIVGLITATIGIANAISQNDFKKLLAYSSIENIGIIGLGIGIGLIGKSYGNNLVASLGFLGALLHTFNHFTFKTVLFYGAGVVYSQTHTRNIDKLGGLIKYIPQTSLLFLIAALAISGLPILSGFIGEFFIYSGMIKSFAIGNIVVSIAAIIGISGLAFIGSMAMITFTKLFGLTFLGNTRSDLHSQPNEGDLLLTLPMVILTVLIFLVGISPFVIVTMLIQIVSTIVPQFSAAYYFQLLDLLNTITISISIFILLIVIIYSIRRLLLRKVKTTEFKTWDCGYQGGTSRMQYTSSSYAAPFMQLIAELVPQKINIQKEKVLFPKEASLYSSSQDVSEGFFIQPIILALKKFMNLFSWIQSGRMQQYIIYGLLFLLALLIWILGVEL